jgi:hypothetical protein
VDEFSRYERWYGRYEPPSACRLMPGRAFSPSRALGDIREVASREVAAARSSAPHLVETHAVRVGGPFAVLVPNLTPARQRCRIAALPARSVAVRHLDEKAIVQKCTGPACIRAMSATLDGCEGNAPRFELAPSTRVEISL